MSYTKAYPGQEIYILENILNSSECNELIGKIKNLKNKHKKSSIISYDNINGEIVHTIWFRKRCFDKEITDLLWNRVKNRIPEEIRVINNKVAHEINNSGTAIYYKNRGVIDHYDMDLASGENLHQYTLLVYLNNDFGDGGTIYYPDYKEGDNVDILNNKLYIKPNNGGSAIIFNRNIRHKGDKVNGEKWGFMFPIFHK